MEGVEENIALWQVTTKSFRHGDKYTYFYTDLNGNLLFGNSFFDYATPFSNGCALVQTQYYSPEIKTFILDIKHHQVLSIPIDFNSANKMMHNSLPVLDNKSNKWGSYIVDTETGIWTYDIPFIWDCLALSRNKDNVYVGCSEDFCYSPNIDNTPYSHMIPDRDEVAIAKMYRVTGIPMTKQEAVNYDYFRELNNHECCRLVENPRRYWEDYPLLSEAQGLNSTNDGTIVETGKLKEYTLKKSYLKR